MVLIEGVLLFLAVFGTSLVVVRHMAASYNRTLNVPPTVEELEAWHDRFDAVVDTDNDESVLDALKAADQAVVVVNTNKVKGRCRRCGLRLFQSDSKQRGMCRTCARERVAGGHTPPPRALGIPKKPPKPFNPGKVQGY